MWKRPYSVVWWSPWIFIVLLWILVYPVRAQTNLSITLIPPETKAFPRLTTYLRVSDGEGHFVSGLQPQDLRLIEDAMPLPVGNLAEQKPGVQFVVAITPGPSFAIRDGLGNTRYDYLSQMLEAWGRAEAPAGDDYSLITDGGPAQTHLADRGEWLAALTSFKPDGRTANANLDALARAVEVAADLPATPGMGSAVLFITAPQTTDVGIGLQSLASRASQQGIHIYIWYVASADSFTSPGAVQLQNLAIQTGGQFYGYSGSEPFPNLEDYLEPLRCIYFLGYDSILKTSGAHKLAVEVTIGGQTVTSAPQSFDLAVQPPNPMFVSPPSQIVRADIAGIGTPQSTYTPGQQSLEILVEFPDGHPRPLVKTTLYVDGKINQENSAAPFEKFTWDLSAYTETGRHLLRVEAVDNLGLTGTSIEIPVEVQVQQPVRGVMVTLSRQRVLLVGLAVILAGSTLALVLILGGRIRPRVFGQGKKPAAPRRSLSLPVLSRHKADPVTQPVLASTDSGSRRLPLWMHRLQWPQRHNAPKAPAYLTPLTEDDESPPAPPIPLTVEEITFGRDPVRVSIVLNDPSVEPWHASLRRQGSLYRLSDEGSIAGTWINYSPVSHEGATLEHGDLIHIGRVGFRFTVRETSDTRKPVVTPQEPNP